MFPLLFNFYIYKLTIHNYNYLCEENVKWTDYFQETTRSYDQHFIPLNKFEQNMSYQ